MNYPANSLKDSAPVALITGSGQRIGEKLARFLHEKNYNIILHCRNSTENAEAITSELNQIRAESCKWIRADFGDHDQVISLAEQALQCWSRIDVLINNASSYFPTPVGTATESQWNELFGSNLKAPFFLSQALASSLKKNNGVIVNMCDIHAIRPIPNHPVYCAAKAGLITLTQALAKDLAPDIRVNGIAPGAILWPSGNEMSAEQQAEKIANIPLGKIGSPDDIIKTAWFLINDAPYITGQIISVDGGRTLNQ